MTIYEEKPRHLPGLSRAPQLVRKPQAHPLSTMGLDSSAMKTVSVFHEKVNLKVTKTQANEVLLLRNQFLFKPVLALRKIPSRSMCEAPGCAGSIRTQPPIQGVISSWVCFLTFKWFD